MKVTDDKSKEFFIESKDNSKQDNFLHYKKSLFENELFKKVEEKKEVQDLSSIFSELMSSDDLNKNTHIENKNLNSHLNLSEIDDNIQILINRILINSSPLTHNKEVVLLIGEKTFLEGVSISLKRLQNGILDINIVCKTYAQYLLIDKDKHILLDYLKEYEEHDPNLQIGCC